MTIYNFNRNDSISTFKPGANDSHNDTVFIKKINTIFQAAAKTNTDLQSVTKFTAILKPANEGKFHPVFRIERANKKPLVLNFSQGNTPITLLAPQLTQPASPPPPTQTTPLLQPRVSSSNLKPAQITPPIKPLKSSSSPKPKEFPKKTVLDKFLSILSSLFSCFTPPRKKPKNSTPSKINVDKPEVKFTRVTSCGLRGLPNQGNTCFMAATFQAIMNDEVLRKSIEDRCCEIFTNDSQIQWKKENAVNFWNAIQNYKEGQDVDLNSLRPLFLSSDRKTQLTGYKKHSQADGVEFFYRILDFLDNVNYYDRQKNLKIGLIKEEQFTCVPLEGDISQVKERTVNDGAPSFVLSVDLTSKKGKTGQQIIDEMLQPQADKGEPFLLDEVLHQKTQKQTVISIPPERFAISLERFTSDRSKNTTAVDMPEMLKMANQNYQLKSMVVHIPGHYYAYVNKKGQWFKANDSLVTRVDNVLEGRQKGYLYFYEKSNPPQ